MKKILIIILMIFLCSCSSDKNEYINNSEDKKEEVPYEERILGTWIFYCKDPSLDYGNTFSQDGTVNYFNKNGEDSVGEYTIDENTIVIDGTEFNYKFIGNNLEMTYNDSTVTLVRGEKKEITGNNSNDESDSFQSTKGFSIENAKVVTDKGVLAKCWTVATKEVKNNLKSPSSAKFPFSAISDGVEILQDRNYYCVHGWVEADNSFGAKIKSDFIVLIEERNGQFIAYDCAIK